jgi:signal transduction histidine kinase
LSWILERVRRRVHIPLDAADHERREHLLNALLLATTTVSLMVIAVNVVVDAFGWVADTNVLSKTYALGAAVLLSNGLAFMLGRFSSQLARWLYVLLLFVIAVLSDSPQQTASGVTLITLAVPVAAAGLLIHPYMSFVIAGMGGLVISFLALSLGMAVPAASIAVLLLVALIAAALVNSFERTLIDWSTANRNLDLLNQASQALSSTLDLDKVLITVLDEVRRLLGAVASSVWLIDSETEELVCRQATEPQGDIVRGWRLPPGEGIAGWVVCTGKSLIVPDLRLDERHYKVVDQSTGLTTRSIISVPLRVREDVIGVLQVVDEALDRFKPADLELLEPLAATAAIAIENARLYAEEQQRAEALAQALEQQRELDRLKDEFLQNISHELRTPLALIMGYAELLKSGELGALQPDHQKPMVVIVRRVRMLSKMVNDLIAIQTVEAHELSEEIVDLGVLADAMLADFKMAAERAELALAAEITPDMPKVIGDPDQLRRVLDNLLGNALKFTPAGGSLSVRLWPDGNGEKKDIVLEVADTGIGIPADKLDRIFDRFYQVDGSSKRQYGGVGLGLALVKEIVEAHDGQVSVESVVGEGSTFRVKLPAAPTG